MAGKKVLCWVGLVNGKIHLYRQNSYYDGVWHGDLFTTRREAKKCYEEVVQVIVERIQPKRSGRQR